LFQHSSLFRSTEHSVFGVPSSADKFGASYFPSLRVTMFVRCVVARGRRRIPGRLSLSLVLGICWLA
jgi:hypothetical protein